MKTRILGKTGLKVGELSLGGVFTSSHGGNFEDSKKAVQKAIKYGINYIDTAPFYFNSEFVLGQIISEIETSEPLIISTKLGGRPEPFEPQNKKALMDSFEKSLELLKRDYIDILMVHEPDRPLQWDWWTDENYNGPVIELLDELKNKGLIRHTGIGGTTSHEMAELIKSDLFDVVLTAFNYSPLWREAEYEILPEAKKRNMGIVIGSPLQQGALARRFDDEINHGAKWISEPRRQQFKKLYHFLDETGLSLPELGLRFVISNPDISCVLMGARSAAEVEQNVESVEKGPLPVDILDRLNEIAAMVPFRPFEEPFWLPFGVNYKGPGAAR